MISSGLMKNLGDLFAGMSAVTFVLTVSGLILITVEFFQPARYIPTLCGAVLIVAGITVRMISGGTVLMLFYMVFGCVIVILFMNMLMLLRHKKTWLTASLAIKLKKSVLEESEDTLLGREGIATTDINEKGHMSLDDVNFVVSSADFIPKNSAVRVVRVSGEGITVEKI